MLNVYMSVQSFTFLKAVYFLVLELPDSQKIKFSQLERNNILSVILYKY